MVNKGPTEKMAKTATEGIMVPMVVTAIALGLAPLLHYQLSRLDLTLPPSALAKLTVTRQAHAKRNEAIARQLASEGCDIMLHGFGDSQAIEQQRSSLEKEFAVKVLVR